MRTHQSGPPTLLLKGLYPLAIVCAFALAVVAYYALERPLTQWRRALASRVEDKRTCLEKGPSLRRRYHAGKDRLGELLERAEQVNRMVPDDPLETEFYAELNEIALAGDVMIEDLRHGQTYTEETHSVIVVKVRARGPYQGLCQLVDRVAKLPRLVELTRMEIEADPGKTTRPALFDFALYYGMSIPPVDSLKL